LKKGPKKISEKRAEDFFKKLYPEAEVSVVALSSGYSISVERSYDYVTVNFSTLMDIAKFFSTQEVNVDEWSSEGCPTCDWGSSYTKSFRITKIGSWNGKL